MGNKSSSQQQPSAPGPIGFWYSEIEHPDLPMPKAGAQDNKAFVAALRVVEAYLDGLDVDEPSKDKDGMTHYRGHAPCRLCDKQDNGAKEYFFRGFQWPEGLGHYLESHGLSEKDHPTMPLAAFRKAVMEFKPPA